MRACQQLPPAPSKASPNLILHEDFHPNVHSTRVGPGVNEVAHLGLGLFEAIDLRYTDATYVQRVAEESLRPV